MSLMIHSWVEQSTLCMSKQAKVACRKLGVMVDTCSADHTTSCASLDADIQPLQYQGQPRPVPHLDPFELNLQCQVVRLVLIP